MRSSVAGVKGRVFGGVVLEVDDVDVDAGLLGVLLELDPFGVGSADHADLDRVALAALGGRLVGTGKRAVAEERGHGDNRHDHDGDDDVAGGVVHTHRLVIVEERPGLPAGLLLSLDFLSPKLMSGNTITRLNRESDGKWPIAI